MKFYVAIIGMLVNLNAHSMTVDEALISFDEKTSVSMLSELRPNGQSTGRELSERPDDPALRYDYYLDSRYARVPDEFPNLIGFSFGESNKRFLNESGESNRKLLRPGTEFVAVVSTINGIHMPIVIVPPAFERSATHYAILVHEIEHIIQNLNVLLEVGLTDDQSAEYDKTHEDISKIIVKEAAAMRAEWTYLNSLSDKLIRESVELVKRHHWSESDMYLRNVFLRMLNAKSFKTAEEYLKFEREFGNRLTNRRPMGRIPGLRFTGCAESLSSRAAGTKGS